MSRTLPGGLRFQFNRRFGAITGIKRELGASVVIYEVLGAAPSGKVENPRNTRRKNNRELRI